MRPVRGAASATIVTALLISAFLALLTWAAAIGPDRVVHADPGGSSVERTLPEPTPTETVSPGARPDPLEDALDQPTDVSWLGIVIAVVGSLGLAYLAFRLLRRLWRAWRDRQVDEADPAGVDFEVLSPPAMAREMADDAAEQQQLLGGGTPRNGIVRCWDRFEQVASRVGLAREPWETPSEFTLRFFDLLEADARPVQRLAALYREARFSDHELAEADRRTAADALAAIHRSLESRV